MLTEKKGGRKKSARSRTARDEGGSKRRGGGAEANSIPSFQLWTLDVFAEGV